MKLKMIKLYELKVVLIKLSDIPNVRILNWVNKNLRPIKEEIEESEKPLNTEKWQEYIEKINTTNKKYASKREDGNYELTPGANKSWNYVFTPENDKLRKDEINKLSEVNKELIDTHNKDVEEFNKMLKDTDAKFTPYLMRFSDFASITERSDLAQFLKASQVSSAFDEEMFEIIKPLLDMDN